MVSLEMTYKQWMVLYALVVYCEPETHAAKLAKSCDMSESEINDTLDKIADILHNAN